MDPFTDNWERVVPWGGLVECVHPGANCESLLNDTQSKLVVEYNCRELVTFNGTSRHVCMCATRQLRQGPMCQDYTAFTYVGAVLAFLAVIFCIFQVFLGSRHLYNHSTPRNTAFFSVLSAIFSAFGGAMWSVGKLFRFLAVDRTTHAAGIDIVNSFAVPLSVLCVMVTDALISLAWLRVVGSFEARKRNVAGVQYGVFEKFLYLYLVLVVVAVIVFSSMYLYFVTSALGILSMVLFTIGFVFSGKRLHRLLHATIGSNGEEQQAVAWNCCKTRSMHVVAESAQHRAVQAIEIYTYKIAFSNMVLVVAMAIFTLSEMIPLASADTNIFHPDVVTEQFISLAIGYCARQVICYARDSKKKVNRETTGAVGAAEFTSNSKANTATEVVSFVHSTN